MAVPVSSKFNAPGMPYSVGIHVQVYPFSGARVDIYFAALVGGTSLRGLYRLANCAARPLAPCVFHRASSASRLPPRQRTTVRWRRYSLRWHLVHRVPTSLIGSKLFTVAPGSTVVQGSSSFLPSSRFLRWTPLLCYLKLRWVFSRVLSTFNFPSRCLLFLLDGPRDSFEGVSSERCPDVFGSNPKHLPTAFNNLADNAVNDFSPYSVLLLFRCLTKLSRRPVDDVGGLMVVDDVFASPNWTKW